MAPTVAEISVRKKPFAGVDFSHRRTSLSGAPLGGGPRRRWKIRHFARAAPKLDAKLALELHRFSQRFGIVIRHDGLHGDRTLVVERASDNTIGRTLKKTFSNRIAGSNG